MPGDNPNELPADRELLRSILTPEFHHVRRFGEWRDRDAMIEAIWPTVGQSWAVNLEIFGDAGEFMVRYQHEHLAGTAQPAMRMAEFIRFVGDRIAEIEVYIGREA
jgi:hypothetical protein